MERVWLAVALAVILLAVGSSVSHAERDPERAKVLFNQGRSLLKDEDFEAACAKFEESYALDAAVGTELNLAECLQHLGKFRRAWQLFQAAAVEDDQAGNARRAEFARGRADALADKLASVIVELPDPKIAKLTVSINDESITPAKRIVHRLDPGPVKIVVEAPGVPRFTKAAEVTQGEMLEVEVPAFARAPVEAGPRRGSRVKLAIGLGIGGGLALLAGGLTGLRGISEYQDTLDSGECFTTIDGLSCTPAGATRVDYASNLTTVANVLAIGGGVIAISAVVVFLTAPRDAAPISVTPIVGFREVGVTLGTRF